MRLRNSALLMRYMDDMVSLHLCAFFIKVIRRDSMLCHMIIDLSVLLCTRSDDRAKLVQRYQ